MVKKTSEKLQHNPDMLYGLAERLSLLTLDCPQAFTDAYTSVMQKVYKEEQPQMKSMTQADKILFLLRKGHRLTKTELMVHHKVATPTARITELRQRGHDIEIEWKTCPVDGSKYVEYWLRNSQKETA